eukprot:972762_1
MVADKLASSPEDVKKAKEEIQSIVNDSDSVTDYIEIRNFERLFIGNGGETNQRLSKQFNVTIRLVGEYGKRRARISGYPEHVKKVKKEIQSIMDDSGSVTDRVDVGSSARLILGHSGETIQRIQEMCNVTADIVGELGESERVEITGEREDVTRAKKMVARARISGSPEDVKKAKEEILSIMDASDSVVTLTEHIDVGSSAKLILGHRGESIRKIRETCNVTVGIVGEVGESQRVKICGKQENVIRAKKMIEDTLASSVTDYIGIGNSDRSFMGNGGETIHRLSKQFNVAIYIVGEYGERQARISGSPEDVKKAKEEIQSIVNDSDSVTDYIEIGNFEHLFIGN